MKKTNKALICIVTVMIGITGIAQAYPCRYVSRHYHYHGGRYSSGDMVVAGLAGAVAGAVIGSAVSSPSTTVYTAPTYVAPAPTYVAPAPAYVAPAPTYVAPAPVYTPPPVIVTPPPVIYGGYYGYRCRPWRRPYYGCCAPRPCRPYWRRGCCYPRRGCRW